MSAVTSANAASGAVTGTPRRTYVSIRPFSDYFFSYSVSTEFVNGNFETTGSLTNVTGATSTTCPAGRILRENGKRLYPGVNPGVSSMMVGVFDDKTFFNGFIDPNAKVFQTQNNDIAPTLPDQVDTEETGTRDLGNGVYTRGDVRAEGDLDVSGSAVIGGNLSVNGTLKVDTIGTPINTILRSTYTLSNQTLVSSAVSAYSFSTIATAASDVITVNVLGLSSFCFFGGAGVNAGTSFTVLLGNNDDLAQRATGDLILQTVLFKF